MRSKHVGLQLSICTLIVRSSLSNFAFPLLLFFLKEVQKLMRIDKETSLAGLAVRPFLSKSSGRMDD